MTSIGIEFFTVLLISIHILHTKDDCHERLWAGRTGISIHILHTKDDLEPNATVNSFLISIHILHTKDDPFDIMTQFNGLSFQSTSFIRRMTPYTYLRRARSTFQSTSFIRRMTYYNAQYFKQDYISIHILHTKDDFTSTIHLKRIKDFNPHPSYEG